MKNWQARQFPPHFHIFLVVSICSVVVTLASGYSIKKGQEIGKYCSIQWLIVHLIEGNFCVQLMKCRGIISASSSGLFPFLVLLKQPTEQMDWEVYGMDCKVWQIDSPQLSYLISILIIWRVWLMVISLRFHHTFSLDLLLVFGLIPLGVYNPFP